jgi:hypothetical protein
MITDERAEQAFEYLRDTVESIGAAKGRLERAEIMRKRSRKAVFVEVSGTVAERDAMAEVSKRAQESDDEYVSAVIAYESLRARRDIETIALDVWRTESANRRRA